MENNASSEANLSPQLGMTSRPLVNLLGLIQKSIVPAPLGIHIIGFIRSCS